MKIKIYINDPTQAQNIMNRIYEIVKESTGKDPNIRITNQNNLKV